MMIHGYIRKSKPKTTKAKREQYQSWLESVTKPMPKFSRTNSTKIVKSVPSPKIPPGRETVRIDSLDTGMIPCTKSVEGNTYTGTKMLGIGTLHKSNAVPVFSDNEAKEMARMRRG